jgi:hypothetical protein
MNPRIDTANQMERSMGDHYRIPSHDVLTSFILPSFIGTSPPLELKLYRKLRGLIGQVPSRIEQSRTIPPSPTHVSSVDCLKYERLTNTRSLESIATSSTSQDLRIQTALCRARTIQACHWLQARCNANAYARAQFPSTQVPVTTKAGTDDIDRIKEEIVFIREPERIICTPISETTDCRGLFGDTAMLQSGVVPRTCFDHATMCKRELKRKLDENARSFMKRHCEEERQNAPCCSFASMQADHAQRRGPLGCCEHLRRKPPGSPRA